MTAEYLVKCIFFFLSKFMSSSYKPYDPVRCFKPPGSVSAYAQKDRSGGAFLNDGSATLVFTTPLVAGFEFLHIYFLRYASPLLAARLESTYQPYLKNISFCKLNCYVFMV